MTRQEFIANDQLCKRLSDFLLDPVVSEALQIALKECQPVDPSHIRGDLIQQAALAGMKTRGVNQFLYLLNSLTVPAKARQKDLGREFDEAAKEELVRQGYSPEEAQKAAEEHYATQNKL